MSELSGEYDCKLDAKGRFILPTKLKAMVPEEAGDKYVVCRGIESCLNLYPKHEWDIIAAKVNKLDTYVKKNRDFIRFFLRGATEISLDSAQRLNLPKPLLDFAGIDKDISLFAYKNVIEVWATEKYNTVLAEEPEDYANLVELIMSEKPEDKE